MSEAGRATAKSESSRDMIGDLTCPSCGNAVQFVEHALMWTKQFFTVPESGSYLDAEWGSFDYEEDAFGLEIVCAECDEIVWRHPRLDEINALLVDE